MQDESSFRVSPQQEQLWAEEADGPTGTVQAVVQLEASLDASALESALSQLVERHEILRTTFVRPPGIRVPLQVINDSLAPRWETLDLTGSDDPDRAACLDVALADARVGLRDFEHGPLVHGLLVDVGAGSQLFALTVSSLCADAASVAVMLDELMVLATGGEVAGEPLQYADFSEWQHEQLADPSAEARSFWQHALDAPAARVPLAQTPSGTATPGEVAVPVDAALSASIAELGARYGSSPAVLVHAAWHAFLSRVTAQDDFAVATFGATPRHPDLDGAVGPIARPLPVRVGVGGTLTFAELVSRLDGALADAAGHQDQAPVAPVPGPAIAARPSVDAAGVSLVRFADRAVSPLTLVYRLAGERFVSLALVFDRSTVALEHAELLAAQFERLLRSAVADPGATVGALELLGDADRELLVDAVNETTADTPDVRVHELFERRAAETPTAIAVTDGTASITYGDLDARANQVARWLRQAGVGAGDVVALCTDRSVEMVVGVLGILKAGGAYVPLNQEHPVARLAHQATESGARALVAQAAFLEKLPEFEQVLCLDRDRQALDALDAAAPEPVGSLDDPVYVIYTSGSTGTPKGVEVTHGNLANYVDDIVRRLEAAGRAYAFGMVTAISTDLGNTAFFPALCSGGTLALIKPDVAVDPAAFAERLEGSPLDVLKITPSHLNALLAANDARLLPRQWLVLGGERLGWDLVDRVRGLAGCRILNHYGPTETTVGSCTMVVEEGRGAYESATVPIGRPIANTRCYVLDEHLHPVPLDVPGRLYIAGAGVARGYIGRPELTDERFVPEPFGAGDARMYDTGDLARRLPDGTLEFLGRVDEQVKIRGFRVEPSEVEAALRNHPSVDNAAVLAVEDTPGDIRLVAYCALGGPATSDELRKHVAQWVPEYMIPSSFVLLESLPLTASGKVDRLALPALAQPASESAADYVAPRTALEEAVATIWADVLKLDRVSVEADFFALGGHSLLATQVVAQVRTDFAIELPLHSLFMCPTVALLSAEIMTHMGAAEHDETAKLLAELEELSEDEASQLVGELGKGDETR